MSNLESPEIKIEPKDPNNGQNSINQSQISKKQLFKCHICGIYANFSYYGNKVLERNQEQMSSSKNSLQKASKKENLILIEKAYICDDPFSELKSINYLILGSNCYECNQMVCVGAECSFFYYNKRFCLKCAKEYIEDDKKSAEFPAELLNEIKKIIEK